MDDGDRRRDDPVVAAALAGDEAAFAVLVDRHRPELQVHCYRMVGSLGDAEDLAQETFLRAWRGGQGFEGRSTYRAWLYRIATNLCLDFLSHSSRRIRLAAGDGSPAEIPWLEPYPDRMLELAAPRDAEPEAMAVAKETIELAFLTAIQLLSPNQRAVFVLRDILGWPISETADALGTSAASVNSAQQRATASLRRHREAGPAVLPQPAKATPTEQALLARYMAAHERADAEAVIELLGEQARFTMPPQPTLYAGKDAVAAFFREAFGAAAAGEFRLVATRANRQPAAANYLRAWGDTVFRALSLDVLRFDNGELVEITTFEPRLFAAFDLPETLDT